jgi:hypothetical protein
MAISKKFPALNNFPKRQVKMTIREVTSYTTRFEILFWDLLILAMTNLARLRQHIYALAPVKSSKKLAMSIFLVGLIWIFLGLYAGFLMGFLGI